MKLTLLKKIWITLLVLFAIVAIGLNAFVLSDSIKLKSPSNSVKKGSPGVIGPVGPQGPKGQKGINGGPGLVGVPGDNGLKTETTFETLPIFYNHHNNDDENANRVFGNLKKWYNPQTKPSFTYRYGSSIFFPNWYNQDTKSDKIFYVGDRIFFNFDIHLDKVSLNKYFGIILRFSQPGKKWPIGSDFTKIWSREHKNPDKLLPEVLEFTSKSLNPFDRIQMAWKPKANNHIVAKGTITFAPKFIFIELTNSIIRDGEKIKETVSMAKLDYQGTIADDGYVLTDIRFGAVEPTGNIFEKHKTVEYRLSKDTVISFSEAPYNKNLGISADPNYWHKIDS